MKTQKSPARAFQIPTESDKQQSEEGIKEKKRNALSSGSDYKQKASSILRRTRGRKSRLSAIILLILSVCLLVISYPFPNILVEVDSVVAFSAALILIYKDTMQSVQLRVVNKILDAYRSEASELVELLKLPPETSFVYELEGERVSDVEIVARSRNSSNTSEGNANNNQKSVNENAEQSSLELVPPGRSLASLFIREMSHDNPSIEDLENAMQPIFSESLGLSSRSNMQTVPDNRVTVRIFQSELKCSCTSSDQHNTEDSLACVVCSLFAVLLCYVSKTPVSIEKCHQETNEGITEMIYRLEHPPDGNFSPQNDNTQHEV